MLRSIRQRLILLVLLVALPLVAATSIVVYQFAQTQLAAQRAALLATTNTLAEAVDAEINKHMAVAYALSTSPSLLTGDLADFHGRAVAAMKFLPNSWLLVVDPSGQQLVNTQRPFGVPLPSIGNRAAHERAIATGQRQISDMFVGTVNRQPLASVHVPVVHDGKPIYNVIVTLHPQSFLRILREQQMPDGWLSGIIDRTGKFVARSRDHDRFVNTLASAGWRTAAAQSNEGEFENISMDGEALFSAFTNSALSGWSISVAASQQVVILPLQRSLWLILLAAGGLIFISVAFAWWAGQRIAGPMHSLEQAAAALLRNEQVAIGRTGLREIDQALVAFEASTHALLERDRRYRSLFENAADAIFIADPSGRFTEVNPAAGRLLGCRPEQIVGKTFLDLLPAADHPRLADAQAQLRQGETLVGEWQLRHASGAYLPTDVSTKLLPDGRWYAFVRDITQRKLAEAAREQTEHQFRTLADSIPQLAWMADADGFIFWYNRRWFEYTGATLDEMRGWGWRKAHHPDHVEGVVARIKRSFETGEPWEDTFPLRGADGQYRWFLSRALPIRDPDGRIVRWFGTNTDVSEQKETEERQRLLVNELNHRVKNTLTVIQSIAAVTARSAASATAFSKSLIARIIGIARTHDLLTESHWAGASLSGVLSNELSPYQSDGAQRATLRGDYVWLTPKIAVSLGMVLHEMATNAAKYGALSTSEGRIEVGWELRQEANGLVLHLEWTEIGGPRVEAPTQQGFGSRLITQSLTRDLSGRVHMDFRPDGLRVTLDIPFADAVDTAQAA